MKKELAYILTLIVFFSLYFIANKTIFADIYHPLQNILHFYPLSYSLTYLIVGIPLLTFVLFSNRYQIFEALGLSKGFIQGVLVAFLFSIPMFIGYGMLSSFKIDIDTKTFWLGCVIAAFFEELYYRGIFFGQIFKNTRLGFFPALIVSALIFASLHLYQSNDVATLIGIFITTFMGAGLFAWLYVEWDYNLWVPISLHFFMNLSWSLFSIADNALGDWSANLFRGLTVLFAIGGTILYKRKQNIPLAVNRDTLIMKKTTVPVK